MIDLKLSPPQKAAMKVLRDNGRLVHTFKPDSKSRKWTLITRNGEKRYIHPATVHFLIEKGFVVKTIARIDWEDFVASQMEMKL